MRGRHAGGWRAHAQRPVCRSSHFCTAERQYRFPLEYGSQRTPTAQWTVTGAGAALISAEVNFKPLARCAMVTVGTVTDMGIADANNMGAAMAPAAADTLRRHFADTGRRAEDYDLIITGDLGKVGHDLMLELMQEQGMPLIPFPVHGLRAGGIRPRAGGPRRRQAGAAVPRWCWEA